MKRLWICGCFALLCGACDDKTADEPVWNGDNYVTAFSLTVGEATYEAVVHDGRITVDVPYDASLDGAEVHYELCEHASIHPDPATIRDWSQEWQFLVSSYGQSDRTYIYTVNRTDVATGGSLTLRTQAEVDAFAASRINVVEGNLTIGVEGGEAIVNLDGLAGLVSVRCDLTVTNAYRGEDLAGLAGLRRCESLRIGSAGAPNETLKRIELPALREVAGDLQLCGTAVRSVVFSALQRVDGAFAVGSDALAEIVADELESVGGDMRLAGSTGNAAKAPCEQMYFPELQRVGGELSVARFGKLGQLATTFGALVSVGSIAYEELALTSSCEFPLIETVGAVALTDCPALRTISLPRLAAAGSFSVEGCPAVETVDLPLVERFEGDVRLASLPAVTDFGALLPRLTAIGGDLTLDDLPGLAGVFDLSKYAFSEHSAVTLRFVSTPKLTELRGGGFAGSLSLDAAALAPQPETMPFALSGFERLDVLHVVGFKGLSALSLPVAACTDLLIENCGTQRAFALSLPALEAGYAALQELRQDRSRQLGVVPATAEHRAAVGVLCQRVVVRFARVSGIGACGRWPRRFGRCVERLRFLYDAQRLYGSVRAAEAERGAGQHAALDVECLHRSGRRVPLPRAGNGDGRTLRRTCQLQEPDGDCTRLLRPATGRIGLCRQPFVGD